MGAVLVVIMPVVIMAMGAVAKPATTGLTRKAKRSARKTWAQPKQLQQRINWLSHYSEPRFRRCSLQFPNMP